MGELEPRGEPQSLPEQQTEAKRAQERLAEEEEDERQQTKTKQELARKATEEEEERKQRKTQERTAQRVARKAQEKGGHKQAKQEQERLAENAHCEPQSLRGFAPVLDTPPSTARETVAAPKWSVHDEEMAPQVMFS